MVKLNEPFDSKFYLEMYPDLVKQGVNNSIRARNHYIKYGKKQGRIGHPSKLKYDISKFPNINLAFLIPLKSKYNWNSINDSYLNIYLLESFKKFFPKNMKYTFYFGIDENEKIYTYNNIENLLTNKLKDFNFEVNDKVLVIEDLEINKKLRE